MSVLFIKGVRCESGDQELLLKILVIEDLEETRVLYSEHLRRVGYHVEEASDGNEGMAVAFQHHPAVIVLDLAIPSLNGWNTADVIRSYSDAAERPIIVCTGLSSDHGRERERTRRCDRFLLKPCPPEKVERAIAELLEARHGDLDRVGRAT